MLKPLKKSLFSSSNTSYSHSYLRSHIPILWMDSLLLILKVKLLDINKFLLTFQSWIGYFCTTKYLYFLNNNIYYTFLWLLLFYCIYTNNLWDLWRHAYFANYFTLLPLPCLKCRNICWTKEWMITQMNVRISWLLVSNI